MKKPLPFSVFKRANRPSYLVAFKNEKTGTYLPPISTRQTSEDAAIKIAYEWFRQGVPKKDKVIDLKEYTLRDLAKEATLEDAEFIVNELKRRGLLKSAVLTESKQDRDFAEFITNFWDYDNSPYIREKLRILKTLKESGALTNKNLERIRAANRRRERKYTLVDKSPLIAELDGQVMDMIKYN
jgi:hypothetical protein